MSSERLQKALARAGVASRRKIEELIVQGRVTLNGARAELGDKVDLEKDHVKVDGKRVFSLHRPHLYLVLNKPRGYVSTTSDPEGRPTVLHLLPPRLHKALFPVGRLDFESEGLLLLTTDGEFAQKVAHPSNGCTKVYEVKAKGEPDEADLNRLRQGIVLDGRHAAPAWVEAFGGPPGRRTGQENSWYRVALKEGRTRQIREMFFRIGHPVQRLKRVQIGGLTDPHLLLGHWRELREDEVEVLRQGVEPQRRKERKVTRQKPMARPGNAEGQPAAPKIAAPATAKSGAPPKPVARPAGRGATPAPEARPSSAEMAPRRTRVRRLSAQERYFQRAAPESSFLDDESLEPSRPAGRRGGGPSKPRRESPAPEKQRTLARPPAREEDWDAWDDEAGDQPARRDRDFQHAYFDSDDDGDWDRPIGAPGPAARGGRPPRRQAGPERGSGPRSGPRPSRPSTGRPGGPRPAGPRAGGPGGPRPSRPSGPGGPRPSRPAGRPPGPGGPRSRRPGAAPGAAPGASAGRVGAGGRPGARPAAGRPGGGSRPTGGRPGGSRPGGGRPGGGRPGGGRPGGGRPGGRPGGGRPGGGGGRGGGKGRG